MLIKNEHNFGENSYNFEWAVLWCVNLADLETFLRMSWLQKSALIQPRASSPKFAEASIRYPPPVINAALSTPGAKCSGAVIPTKTSSPVLWELWWRIRITLSTWASLTSIDEIFLNSTKFHGSCQHISEFDEFRQGSCWWRYPIIEIFRERQR